jgi:5'-3' exonuclease
MKKISSPFPTYDYIFVDTMNLASISYFAQTRLSWNGKPTGMLFGVLRQILFLKKKYPEAKIIFLWEGYNSIRKSKYPFYKSKRHAKDNSFLESLDDVKMVLPWLGVYQCVHAGVEADDLAGYFCEKYLGKKILLVSNDRDWWAFVADNRTSVLFKNEEHTIGDLETILGFAPSKIVLFKILKGDPSDNVGGIPRFNTEEAVRIVQQSRNIEDFTTYASGKWKDTIILNQDIIHRNHDLLSFHMDWINNDRLIIVKPIKADDELKKLLTERGMQSTLHQLHLD